MPYVATQRSMNLLIVALFHTIIQRTHASMFVINGSIINAPQSSCFYLLRNSKSLGRL
ncbi:hypothetical protein CRENPOLYSF1_300046 [Crenothrix polyspora]|uniref:Uncharacterized protein n=1 Tax=Crenothrix polyspora TaxID=360316 RepID=A0A1R4H998_9GAMM|nr:hypothetical protein CRENPOLYSF1_300046 [Crenothrix polyspora]